jgi:hypothetical protein
MRDRGQNTFLSCQKYKKNVVCPLNDYSPGGFARSACQTLRA